MYTSVLPQRRTQRDALRLFGGVLSELLCPGRAARSFAIDLLVEPVSVGGPDSGVAAIGPASSVARFPLALCAFVTLILHCTSCLVTTLSTLLCLAVVLRFCHLL